jgi:uncharacterized protein (TIGR02452 family)
MDNDPRNSKCRPSRKIPLALCFADPSRPGGSFRDGQPGSQEESLCRASLLYNFLQQSNDFYKKTYPPENPRGWLYRDQILLVEHLPFIRDEKGDLLDEPFVASVFMCSAPNARQCGDQVGFRDLDEAYRQRVLKILQCAIAGGYGTLILGAFGCGVYENQRYHAALAFQKFLNDESYVKYFQNVWFAIYRDKPSFQNFQDVVGRKLP